MLLYCLFLFFIHLIEAGIAWNAISSYNHDNNANVFIDEKYLIDIDNLYLPTIFIIIHLINSGCIYNNRINFSGTWFWYLFWY